MDTMSSTVPNAQPSSTRNSAALPSSALQSRTFLTVRDVDKQLRRLWYQCCYLRTQRNSLTPASRLPPEVLSTIFRLHLSAVFRASSRTGVPDPRWFVFSHVCAYWREVAILDKGLWSEISLFQPRWAKEMLRRSVQHPITIDMGCGLPRPKVYDLVADTIHKHTPRIRTLDLTAFTSKNLSRMLSAASSPAEKLEELSVTLKIDRVDADFTLKNFFFSGATPRLKKLTLNNCEIKWDSPLLYRLTELRLDFTPEDLNQDIGQLLDALDNLPDLRILSLANCLPEHPGHFLSSPRLPRLQTQLPYLRHLHLTGYYLSCGEFLRYIALKGGCVVDVYAFEMRSSLSVYSTLTQGLKESGAFCDGHAPVTLTVEDFIDGSVRIVGMSSYGASMTPRRDDLDLYLDLTDWTPDAPALATEGVCYYLDLRKLEVLHIWDLGFFHESSWKATFGASVSLSRVWVRGTAIHGLMKALEDPQFMPQLQHLIVEHADFQKDFLPKVRGSLRKRRHIMKDIDFRHCFSLDNLDVDQLRDAIQIPIAWDAHEGRLSDGDSFSDLSSESASDNDSSNSRYGSDYESLNGLDYEVW